MCGCGSACERQSVNVSLFFFSLAQSCFMASSHLPSALPQWWQHEHLDLRKKQSVDSCTDIGIPSSSLVSGISFIPSGFQGSLFLVL